MEWRTPELMHWIQIDPTHEFESDHRSLKGSNPNLTIHHIP